MFTNVTMVKNVPFRREREAKSNVTANCLHPGLDHHFHFLSVFLDIFSIDSGLNNHFHFLNLFLIDPGLNHHFHPCFPFFYTFY